MKRLLQWGFCVCLCIAGSVFADLFDIGDSQFEIEFVTISNETNPASGAGIVDYKYRMGVYEITCDQYGLFEDFTTGANPACNITWFQAAQFVNWLNVQSGHQAAYNFTSTGSFELWDTDQAWGGTNLFRHKEAYYFLPTDDEWVKAAYWNGASLQTYATPDDTLPVEDVQANYAFSLGAHKWDVGSGAVELNATYDMMGNACEWLESSRFGEYSRLVDHRYRGGDFASYSYQLKSSEWFHTRPGSRKASLGFRVASIPEPATLALLALGGWAVLRKRKRLT